MCLLWLQWDSKKCPGFFLNLEISQAEVYICELWLTLTSICEVQEGEAERKSTFMLPTFGHLCQKRFPGVPCTFKGESGELLSTGAESLDLPSCRDQPPLPSPSQHSANSGISSTAAIEQPWQLLAPLIHLCLLGQPPAWGMCDLGKKIRWTSLHPTPASLCTLGRMLSALNALSIPRDSKPSQAILGFILQTSWFSCISLSKYRITILGKSLSFWALKTMAQKLCYYFFFFQFMFSPISFLQGKITSPLLVTLIINFHIFLVNPAVQGHWVLFLSLFFFCVL